jgi:hypothetical protein
MKNILFMKVAIFIILIGFGCFALTDFRDYAFIRYNYFDPDFHQFPLNDTNKVDIRLYDIASHKLNFKDGSPYLLFKTAESDNSNSLCGIYSFYDSVFYFSVATKGSNHSFHEVSTMESEWMLNLLVPYISDTLNLAASIKDSAISYRENYPGFVTELQLFRINKKQKSVYIKAYHW